MFIDRMCNWYGACAHLWFCSTTYTLFGWTISVYFSMQLRPSRQEYWWESWDNRSQFRLDCHTSEQRSQTQLPTSKQSERRAEHESDVEDSVVPSVAMEDTEQQLQCLTVVERREMQLRREQILKNTDQIAHPSCKADIIDECKDIRNR